MKHQKSIVVLVLLISIITIIVASYGIFSNDGSSQYEYISIRGESITIYGKGVYKHMSSDVAVQGIAQDYVTLFIGVPLLLLGLYLATKGSMRGLFLLSGALGYFLLTYLFYTAMGMYNILFLPYVFILCLSFFAFILTLFSYNVSKIKGIFSSYKILRFAGVFLIINSSMMALLWLSTIIPPLLDGTIYPVGLQHYTTLIVQGFDLGLFLPIGFVSGVLALKSNSFGYLFTTIYVIFLFLLMTALTSKVVFMAKIGANVIPVIFIMPTIALVSFTFTLLLLKNIRTIGYRLNN